MQSKPIQTEQAVGKGQFGQVHKGSYFDRSVVVKTWKKAPQNAIDFQSFGREAYISMLGSEHVNIVKFWGASVPSSSSPNQPWCLVYQYMAGGSVESALLKKRRYIEHTLEDVKVVLQMCLNAAQGLAHLHSRNIIHRDVACRNLLLSEDHQLVWFVCFFICCFVDWKIRTDKQSCIV